MSRTPTPANAPPQPPAQPFTLYAAQDRVLCSNKRDKLVDLGLLECAEDGRWRYRLDGDGSAAGAGFAAPEEALADVASRITFLFLDGQFTALADVGAGGRPDLADAPQIHIALDPLGQGTPAIEADI